MLRKTIRAISSPYRPSHRLANVERAISSWIMTRPIRRNFEHHFLSRRCALAWLAYSRVIQHRHSPDRSEIQRTWDAAK
jgi:hypothetical protein